MSSLANNKKRVKTYLGVLVGSSILFGLCQTYLEVRSSSKFLTPAIRTRSELIYEEGAAPYKTFAVEYEYGSFYKGSKYTGARISIEKVFNQLHFPRLEASYKCALLFPLPVNHVDWPPPKYIPEDLSDLFTMGRIIPTSSMYFAQKYSGGTALVDTWSLQMVESFVASTIELRNQLFTANTQTQKKGKRKIQKRISTYGYRPTLDVAKAMHLWNSEIYNCHVLVIGSERPWLEGMLLAFGARQVTTLEYGRIKSEHPRVQTITVSELNSAISGNRTEYLGLFDTVFSYSSIEHSGLGRYGDPINPFGDVEQVAQASCLLRKNGVFFLGFPIGKDELEWNAHRIYGKVRLPLVTLNFALLDILGEFDWKKSDSSIQPILVLRNQYLSESK